MFLALSIAVCFSLLMYLSWVFLICKRAIKALWPAAHEIYIDTRARRRTRLFVIIIIAVRGRLGQIGSQQGNGFGFDHGRVRCPRKKWSIVPPWSRRIVRSKRRIGPTLDLHKTRWRLPIRGGGFRSRCTCLQFYVADLIPIDLVSALKVAPNRNRRHRNVHQFRSNDVIPRGHRFRHRDFRTWIEQFVLLLFRYDVPTATRLTGGISGALRKI